MLPVEEKKKNPNTENSMWNAVGRERSGHLSGIYARRKGKRTQVREIKMGRQQRKRKETLQSQNGRLGTDF